MHLYSLYTRWLLVGLLLAARFVPFPIYTNHRLKNETKERAGYFWVNGIAMTISALFSFDYLIFFRISVCTGTC